MSQPGHSLPADALANLVKSRTKELEANPTRKWIPKTFPDNCVVGEDGRPLIFNPAQQAAMDALTRVVAIISGPQLGKTILGPVWMWREIMRRGRGDYGFIGNDFDMFHLKGLPAYVALFCTALDMARLWSVDRMLEIRDPATGQYWASKAGDAMWARLMMRSADDRGGLESMTANAIDIDEAGLENFDESVWHALRFRRASVKRARLLIKTTLYNVGGGWLKKHIMDEAFVGGEQTVTQFPTGEMIITVNLKNDITLIQADSTINSGFSMEEFTGASARMADDVFQSMYRGRIVQSRFAIYDIFDAARHTCPRFDIPADWKRIVGVDFGGSHTAAVYLAQNPQNKIWYAYREYHAGGKTALEHVRAILYGEPSRLWAVGGSPGETSQRLEFSKAGLPIREPRLSDVWLGVNLVYSMLKTDTLIVFDDLHGTLEMFPKYRKKRGRDGHPTEDIENKGDFHFLDDLRYFATIAGGGGVFLG